ncbi:MAG: hypothetical protein R6X21_02655 [Candidatus Aminicenantes bacterium]
MTEPRETFDSWKEIAAYLKRSVRTCRNFEQQMGLPVHRLDGSPKARVFAYRDEIDAWLAKKGTEGKKKRLTLLFAALAAAAVVVSSFLIWRLSVAPQEPDSFGSVAILPVINETGDAEREYFADGLTRMLNAELYKVAALKVPPAETILSFKNSGKSARKIAAELGVEVLVHCSWLQAGGRHRLIYSVTDPIRNECLAADTLESEEKDIIILQRELARAVAEAVKVVLTPAEQALLAGGGKVDPAAYSLLMKGIAAADQPDEWDADPPSHLEYFQKAIDIDPGLALAHAWLGFEYFGLGINRIEDHRLVYPKAWKALGKALEIDNNLAMAYSARAYLKFMMNWDPVGAERDFHTALELAPGDMFIPILYETFLCISGRADLAIDSITARVRGADPIGLESRYRERRSFYYLCAGRYDDALKALDGARLVGVELTLHVIWAKALKGSHAEALEIAEKLNSELGNKPHPFFRRQYPMILAVTGQREEALRALKEYKTAQARKNMDMRFDEACVYACLGDRGEAFELLDRLYEERSSDILLLASDWALHSLHGDPRFEELARKIGFPVIPRAKKAQDR